MQTLIEAFEQGPARLRAAVTGVSDELLRFKPAPEKWSILEVVVHLVDTEIVVAQRLYQTIAENRPPIVPFDQDAWANRLSYRDADLEEELALFEALRRRTASRLRKLTAEDWDRVGDRAGQPVTVRELVEKFTAHVDRHIAQIERNKAAYAGRTAGWGEGI